MITDVNLYSIPRDLVLLTIALFLGEILHRHKKLKTVALILISIAVATLLYLLIL